MKTKRKVGKSCQTCGYQKLLLRMGNPLKCIRCREEYLERWEPIERD